MDCRNDLKDFCRLDFETVRTVWYFYVFHFFSYASYIIVCTVNMMHTSFILIAPLVSSISSFLFADMIHTIVNMCQIRLLYFEFWKQKQKPLFSSTYNVCSGLVCIHWFEVRCDCSLCWYWSDVIARYVDIGEMWLLVMLILVRCDCSLCWYWWNCWPSMF